MKWKTHRGANKKKWKEKTKIWRRWWNLINFISACNSIAHNNKHRDRPTYDDIRTVRIFSHIFFPFAACFFPHTSSIFASVVTSLFILVPREGLPISGFIEFKMRIKFHTFCSVRLLHDVLTICAHNTTAQQPKEEAKKNTTHFNRLVHSALEP